MRQIAMLAAVLGWSAAIQTADSQESAPGLRGGASTPRDMTRYNPAVAAADVARPSRELELQALNERAAVLEAQGRTFEADRLRHSIATIAIGEGSRLLFERHQQLETLQQEVDAIRRITGHTAQVMLTITAIEISRTKLQELGIEPSSELLPTAESQEMAGYREIVDSQAVLAHIEHLKRVGAARCLADPSLVATTDRPCEFHSGGLLPQVGANGQAPTTHLRVGTEVKATINWLANGKLRLDLSVRLAEVDPSRAVKVGGNTVPGVRIHQTSSAVDLEPGKLAVFAFAPYKVKVEKSFLLPATEDTLHRLVLVQMRPVELQAQSQDAAGQTQR